MIVDRSAGIVFAGGVAFRERVPTTTPRRSQALAGQPGPMRRCCADSGARLPIPSHGPALGSADAIAQTRAYLQWLDARMTQAASEGRDPAEVIRHGGAGRLRALGRHAGGVLAQCDAPLPGV
ncbi:hypothetical protein ACU4GD_10140 [Cupriavidus basilensis]